ncbi:hypothetical protein LTR56_016271 [Elasticomyces elasticus]|nr:hypothetical protein LTR56_016271 [Elasticomyces elasticus]KAK3634252.1 hypothetical protein LTR22_019698 [Elasticomyces elasticus]KAK4915268.1 hypothetical protein LTR49_016537 [Elasticomyces elasticus]KAK5754678.1 hypothetical protein LTS12_015283 [Elasticomyces elasticus]
MLRLLSIAAATLLAISGVAARYGSDDEHDEEDGGLEKRATISPIMDGRNFPDPAIIKVADGWHAFATNVKKDGSWIHVPMAKSPDYKKWTYRDGVDAMPKLAAWVDPNSPRVWAPDVVQLGDGTFIMYYTAASKRQTDIHCVSWAHSKKLEGPYVDNLKEPWVCPYATGGAIDPAGYTNKDGTRWVVYKIDGNAVGHGGSCNNNVEPIVSTPIMLQQVNGADGHTKIGSPIQLIKNDKADGPVVEAPALTYLGGKYVLFFSSNCFATTLYDVSYATADHIKGPYTKYGPLFVTGTLGMISPGGLDIAMNGDHAIWHGATSNGRGSYTALLSMKGNQVIASTLS